MKTTTTRNNCIQCGTCCESGGPALHLEDLQLVRSGRLPRARLITIRRGELVHHPLAGALQPVPVELVKIVGQGETWQCWYYSPAEGCRIYRDRPQACRVLKCWDTGPIAALMARETLSRRAILGEESPLLPLIAEHQRLCPVDKLHLLLAGPANLDDALRQSFSRQVDADLRFRGEVVTELALPLAEELFIFGRPLFQLLQQLGVGVAHSATGIRLLWPGAG